MFGSLKGKKVLVTGSSTGIGASIADLFARYGCDVGIHYCSHKKEATKVMAVILEYGVKVRIFQGDLTIPAVRRGLIAKFLKAFGGIDILINNAGAIYEYKHFSDVTERSWDKTFALNAKAPFYLIGQAFEYMKHNGGGRIINISTASVKYGGSPYNMHYCASKAALDTMTAGFSRAGAQHGILVNSIRCGLIDTPMQDKIPGYRKDKFLQRVSLVPLKRAGKPEDIARMAVFLASSAGDFITGQIIPVSGGE
jgi:3-oxoacyl-[acyl-carrier protein] reductase